LELTTENLKGKFVFKLGSEYSFGICIKDKESCTVKLAVIFCVNVPTLPSMSVADNVISKVPGTLKINVGFFSP
jgi:hypothetical protein